MQLFESKGGDDLNGASYNRGQPPAALTLAFRPLPQGGRPAGASLHLNQEDESSVALATAE